MNGERDAVLGKLEGDINELKTEGKITGFKIYRIEKSLDDLKEVLERLTDVYHNQSMIQKDIVSIFKELSELKVQTDENKTQSAPMTAAFNEHVTQVKTSARIATLIFGVLYGIGAWTINETLTYAKENNARIYEIEKTSIENTIKIEQLKSAVGEVGKPHDLKPPSGNLR
jgi:hypothetical protein